MFREAHGSLLMDTLAINTAFKEQTVWETALLLLGSIDSDEPYCPCPRSLPASVKMIFQQHRDDSVTIFHLIRLQPEASAIPSHVSFKPVRASRPSSQPCPNPDFHEITASHR